MPRVSVIVPNYNYARYLDERIRSLLTQTWRDLELIIVDDASTDESLAVIDRYASDPRVRTLLFDENSGSVFRRWNDGAGLATGEFLMFAGADDTCDPTLVETLAGVLDRHPNVAVACSQSWEIDEHGQRVRIKQMKPRWARDFIVTGDEEAPYNLTEPTIQNASAALVRRRIFEEAGAFDLGLGICADWMLWSRVVSLGDLAFVARPLNCYRKHRSSVRSQKRAGADLPEQYHVVDFILNAFDVDEATRSGAWDRVANLWVSRVLADGWRLDTSFHLKTFRALRGRDPRPGRRLVRLLITRMRSRMTRLFRGPRGL